MFATDAMEAAAPAVTDLETNDRRSSQLSSLAMERPTLEAVCIEAGANAMVAEAERSIRAADWKTFIFVFGIL